MKDLIIFFSLAIVCVLAQRGPPPPPDRKGPHGGPGGPAFFNPWQNYPGCNISTYPGGVNGSFCCPSKPKCFMNESFGEACKTECPRPERNGNGSKSDSWCCFSKCILKQAGVLKADGTLDGDAVASKLKTLTNKSDIWDPIIKKVVDSCIAQGPSLLEQFKNLTNKNVTCDAAVNKAIEQCIKRQLFLQCPEAEKTKADNCTKLFDFANACPGYPFMGGHGKGPGHSKEKGGKGDKPSKTDGKQKGGKPSGGDQKPSKAPEANASKAPAANQAAKQQAAKPTTPKTAQKGPTTKATKKP